MATVTSLTATPTVVAPGGGTASVVPVIANADQIATVTVKVDGATGTAKINIHETLVFSVNPADVGKPGRVVGSVDAGGTLAVGADNASFVFTAS